MRQDSATLLDIDKAAHLIQSFLEDSTKETFFNDPKTQSSVLYQLLVIGEAVKRLSPEFRNQNSAIPWLLIAGMRDHLIHAYRRLGRSLEHSQSRCSCASQSN